MFSRQHISVPLEKMLALECGLYSITSQLSFLPSLDSTLFKHCPQISRNLARWSWQPYSQVFIHLPFVFPSKLQVLLQLNKKSFGCFYMEGLLFPASQIGVVWVFFKVSTFVTLPWEGVPWFTCMLAKPALV